MGHLNRFALSASTLLVASVFGAAAVVNGCGESSETSTTTPDGSPTPTATPTPTPTPTPTTPPPADAGADVITDASPTDAADAAPLGPAACVGGGSDPQWAQVLTYIPCTGATIADVTGKATITQYNTPTISATPAGAPGGKSCALGQIGGFGTAHGFEIQLANAIGTGDYTIEFALYQTAFTDPSDQQSEILISSTAYPPSPGLFPAFYAHQTVNKIQFISGATGVTVTDEGSTLNAWRHYAASRVAGTTYVFSNGTLLGSVADPTDYTDKLVYVGHQANGSYNAVIGSIGQIRITAAGRYTAAYQTCANGYVTN